MASLIDAVSSNVDELRLGIANVIFYRSGRSWHSKAIWLYDDKIDPDDLNDVTAILDIDKNAVMLNGYYSGRLGEDMSVKMLAAGVRWHYENNYNSLDYYMNEYSGPLPFDWMEDVEEDDAEFESSDDETGDEKASMKTYYCVITKFYDSGKVEVSLMKEKAYKRPTNTLKELVSYDIYCDYFPRFIEAQDFMKEMKESAERSVC